MREHGSGGVRTFHLRACGEHLTEIENSYPGGVSPPRLRRTYTSGVPERRM